MSEYLVFRSLSLSSPELEKASESERAFLLAMGHLQNEVATLNKLFVWSIPRAAVAVRKNIHSVLHGRLLKDAARKRSQSPFDPMLPVMNVCSGATRSQRSAFGPSQSRS